MPLRRHILSTLLPLALTCAAAPLTAQDTAADAPAATTDGAPTMEAVLQAYQAGDFVFVRRGLEELIKDDTNALAHYRYGRALLQGLGGPADRDQAVVWLRKAVSLNHIEASTLLARIYINDRNYYDVEEAARLFASAAARDDVEAKYYLGKLYKQGMGVPKDDVQAFSWFLAAAEAQHAAAKLELSAAYAQGVGTEKNTELAMEWLQSAAADGNAEAQHSLAFALDQGPEAFRNKDQALDWYRRAAERGHPLAQRALGTKYLNGLDGVEPNANEALKWLTAAAEGDDAGAMHNLGIGYAQGTVLPRDDQLAAYWFERGSEEGLGRSSLTLGAFYQAGRGVPQDLALAVRYYKEAILQGERQAALQLAEMAIDGSLQNALSPHEVSDMVAYRLRQEDNDEALTWLETQAAAGVRPAIKHLGFWFLEEGNDTAQAVTYLEQAATAGSVPAQARLGALYSTGDGVELDYIVAHKWLNIAAAGGDTEAAETRSLINDLMTPEQIADAQAAARKFFDGARKRAPQTDQVVRNADGDVITPKADK